QQPLECRADAHVVLLGRSLAVTASSLPSRTTARRFSSAQPPEGSSAAKALLTPANLGVLHPQNERRPRKPVPTLRDAPLHDHHAGLRSSVGPPGGTRAGAPGRAAAARRRIYRVGYGSGIASRDDAVEADRCGRARRTRGWLLDAHTSVGVPLLAAVRAPLSAPCACARATACDARAPAR